MFYSFVVVQVAVRFTMTFIRVIKLVVISEPEGLVTVIKGVFDKYPFLIFATGDSE